MAWQSIKDRLAGLPLILVGPILRRVEKDNVSVWVALKEARTSLTLTVYGPTGAVMRGSQPTVPLGQHLHIALITATPIAGVLTAGTTYEYNVTGTGITFENNPDLCYPGFTRPSFALPPTNLSDLRIIHASCRKLHAGGTDAMATLDKMIGDTVQTPNARPHQLFLTGDQIYADDVNGLLLYLIRDICDTDRNGQGGLLNWTENLPVGDWPNSLTNLDDHREYDGLLDVGRRSSLLEEESGLHFPGEWEVTNNHLIKLGEYYAMYLLMWSPTLWPAFNDYPSFRQVYSFQAFPDDNPKPGEAITGPEEQVAEQPDDDSDSLYMRYIKSVVRAQQYGQQLQAVRKALANVPTYMICDDHEITDDWFLDMHWCMTVLSKGLGRRILQNGMTAYALFQAWGNWPQQFQSGLGARLLTTIARCNEPAGYDQTDAIGSLLTNVQYHDYWDTLAIIVGLPDRDESFRQRQLVPQHTGRLVYNYHIAWEKHEVVVLDTRTARAYPNSSSDSDSDSNFAALISHDSLITQLPDLSDTAEVTFLVIATPISGVPNVEEDLTGLGRTIAIDNIYYSEGYVDKNDANYFTDAEAYGYQQKGLQDLYAVIGHRVFERQQRTSASTPGRIVVLSGDVHYGFTNRVEFWAKRFADMNVTALNLPTTCHFVLAQLCASALKNEKSGTVINAGFIKKNLGTYGEYSIHQFGYTEEELADPAIWLGWLPPGSGVRPVGTWSYPTRPTISNINGTKQGPIEVSKEEYIFDMNKRRYKNGITIDGLATPPDWEYRINYLTSLPDGLQPTAVTAVTSPDQQQQAVALQNYLAAASNSMMFFLNDGPGSEVVGKNNIGEVTFIWGNTEATKFLRHNLWWSQTNDNGTDKAKGPHSKFVVLLGEDAAKYPKPSPTY